MELEDTRLKFIQGNREYDEKMKLPATAAHISDTHLSPTRASPTTA